MHICVIVTIIYVIWKVCYSVFQKPIRDFSDVYWMPLFSLSVKLSAAIPCVWVVSSSRRRFQLRSGGIIFGTQVVTSAGGEKIEDFFFFPCSPGLCFLFWRIGHFSPLAKMKLFCFLFSLGDVQKVWWQEAMGAAAYLLFCFVVLRCCPQVAVPTALPGGGRGGECPHCPSCQGQQLQFTSVEFWRELNQVTLVTEIIFFLVHHRTRAGQCLRVTEGSAGCPGLGEHWSCCKPGVVSFGGACAMRHTARYLPSRERYMNIFPFTIWESKHRIFKIIFSTLFQIIYY